jgi:hypothetical protein
MPHPYPLFCTQVQDMFPPNYIEFFMEILKPSLTWVNLLTFGRQAPKSKRPNSRQLQLTSGTPVPLDLAPPSFLCDDDNASTVNSCDFSTAEGYLDVAKAEDEADYNFNTNHIYNKPPDEPSNPNLDLDAFIPPQEKVGTTQENEGA